MTKQPRPPKRLAGRLGSVCKLQDFLCHGEHGSVSSPLEVELCACAAMSGSGRPGAGKKQRDSWTAKLHQKHKSKFHSTVSDEEVAPLLAADNNDVEDQPLPQKQQSSSEWILYSIRKRTTPILAGFVILLAMAVIGVSIGWAIDRRGHARQSFCMSSDCSDAAARIFMNLAPNYTEIDPCTNFQQFACGGFHEYHKLRPDQSRVGTLSIMAEENQQTLRHVLEKKATDIQAKDRANFKKLKADYDACMDEMKIKSYGLAPLRVVTEHLKAKYPVEASLRPLRKMSQLNIRPAVKDITDAITYMTSIGVESVLQFYVGVSWCLSVGRIVTNMHCRPTTKIQMRR